LVRVDPGIRDRLVRLLADYGAKVRQLIENHRLDKHGIDGADIEQEVRIRLWRALEREPEGTFNAAFIQRVVLTTVIDAVRAAAARPSEPLPDEDDATQVHLVEPTHGPERTAAERQRFAVLQACLAKLPERRRDAAQLHLQGFTAFEIAQRLNLSEDAARKLAERALGSLRAYLSDAGVDIADD